MIKQKQQYLTVQEALPKMAAFCAYQDRCHQEVIEKLEFLGINDDEALEVVSFLIKEKYLDEERFARTYARSKFRHKHWGRLKIKQALKHKGLNDTCIKLGLSEIDPNEYYEHLTNYAQKKLDSLQNDKNATFKTIQFLVGKGFEYNLITDVLSDLKDV